MGGFRDQVYVEHPDCHPYSTALDEPGSPAPIDLDTTERLNAMIGELTLRLIEARHLASRLGDRRARLLVDALAAMPGDGS